MDNNNTFNDLFTVRQYVPITYQYKDVKEVIKHSTAASTDYDLTGQVIWPSSEALSQYIINHKDKFNGKIVMELGAGAGLSGIVAANYAKEIIITDGMELVVELLKINVQQSRHHSKLTAQFFDWKDYQTYLKSKDISKLDFVIGADIIFWPISMQPLCQTLDHLIKTKNSIEIIIAVKNRSNKSQQEFQQWLKKYNLQWKLLCIEMEIPIYSVVRKQL